MNTIAQIIKEQIGHNAFVMMGTSAFGYTNNSLSFNVKGSDVKSIKIVLNGWDLYDVTFYTAAGQKEISNLYCDMLHEAIERESGLYLSL